MKKKVYKILAAMFAMAVIAASPTASIKSHALGFDSGANGGKYDYGISAEDYYKDPSDFGYGTPSQPAPAPEAPAPAPEAPAPAPSVEENHTESSQPAPEAPATAPSAENNGSSNSGSATTSQPAAASAPKAANTGSGSSVANDVTVNVPGGQKFRSVMNKDHTVYQVYHMGISRASFTVKDAKGNVVAFSTVTLEQGEDKLWYENITLPKGVDTKGLTVKVTKGDATYLSENLGVSGIKLNGTIALSTVPEDDAE